MYFLQAYGCISRFEIQHSLYEFEKSAILAIDRDETLNTISTTAWAQEQRITSDFFVNSAKKHTHNVLEMFKMSPFRRGFSISQDVPWSANQLKSEPSFSNLQYAQVVATQPRPHYVARPASRFSPPAL
jgi:hypothetical protein